MYSPCYEQLYVETRVPVGFYIVGRHTTIAWYRTKTAADAECKRLTYRGIQCHVEPSY